MIEFVNDRRSPRPGKVWRSHAELDNLSAGIWQYDLECRQLEKGHRIRQGVVKGQGQSGSEPCRRLKWGGAAVGTCHDPAGEIDLSSSSSLVSRPSLKGTPAPEHMILYTKGEGNA